MNKKAAFFHWVLFGVLAALGFFFIFTTDNVIDVHKGENQLEILDFYLEFKANNIVEDSKYQQAISETIISLAAKGGIINETGCSNLEGVPLWNLGGTYCYPSEEQAFILEFSQLAEKKALFENDSFEFDYSTVFFSGTSSEKRILNNSKIEISIPNSFAINTGYNLAEEYAALKNQASILILECSDKDDLATCLNSNKEKTWHYSDCNDKNYFESERKVLFCVDSPSRARVLNESGQMQEVQYKLALDFTPTEPTIIENKQVSLSKDASSYLIRFDESQIAQEYSVYVTSVEYVEYEGPAEDFRVFGSTSTGDFDFENNFKVDEIDYLICPFDEDFFEAGYAYSCNSEVIFVLDATTLNPANQYYVTITSHYNGLESDVSGFVELI